MVKGVPFWGALLSFLLAAAWLRRWQRFAVAGDSMVPGLLDGDWVLVNTLAYRRGQPAPGHIVIAADPRNGHALVKRVAAVDGDAIWLLGDNGAASTDSRAFGAVPLDAIAGRVRWRYWPDPLHGWL